MRAETNLTAQRLAVNIMWSGDDMRVIPGYGFCLEGHDTPAFNQEWLVVRVAHRGSQIGVLEEDSVERGMIEDETSENGNHYGLMKKLQNTKERYRKLKIK
ncbi:hypothetical protein [Rodentibacter caecimuris]|uniref:hypothetical protein n=1 Tax=Rodentibacter caecimuris TaxID=1796644 RepID=UPI00142EF84B|nr:hypothetical protein [Rodentibacter heylii]MCX2961809.1 hypothetical protein [Rodentibacter heylii]